MQLQAVQGASLVGRDVIVAGNKLERRRRGRHRPGRLRARRRRRRGQGRDPRRRAARSCRRSTSAPRAPACTASTGRRARRPARSGLTFRVSATTGGVATTATPLMRDRVDAISTTRHQLQPRARELGHASRTAPSRPSTRSFPRPYGRVHRKRTRHGFPARSFRSERVEQEPRGDRQQHRQRQHDRRQGVARRVRRRLRQRDRRQQRRRHRRHGRRRRPAVHAGQHLGDRQPARHRHQRQRLLRGQQGRHGQLHAQRPVQGRPRRASSSTTSSNG